MKTAVVPGSFDPITKGHLDVIKRALRIAEKVIVLVGENPSKKGLFTTEERIELIKESLNGQDNVEVDSFDGLLLDYLNKRKVNIVVRGLRAVSDFEYEFQRALFNRKLDNQVETIFVMTKDEYSFLKSSIVKEIAMFGGDVSQFVPECVNTKLKEKFSS